MPIFDPDNSSKNYEWTASSSLTHTKWIRNCLHFNWMDALRLKSIRNSNQKFSFHSVWEIQTEETDANKSFYGVMRCTAPWNTLLDVEKKTWEISDVFNAPNDLLSNRVHSVAFVQNPDCVDTGKTDLFGEILMWSQWHAWSIFWFNIHTKHFTLFTVFKPVHDKWQIVNASFLTYDTFLKL